MRQTVERALEDVDLVCVIVDVTMPRHPDPEMLDTLGRHRGPAYCVLNKTDRLRAKSRLLPLIDAWRAGGRFREIVPVSALDGTNCDRLLRLIVDVLPEHPAFFPPDATSDQPETFYVAEMIREKVFLLTHEEIPYAVAVRVEELTERPKPEALYIRATIFVERDSQKGILIGRGGGMLKRIGTAARRDLEAFFGIKVYLDLTVQVRPGWRKDEGALREFGFLMTS
jgi:GTPase